MLMGIAIVFMVFAISAILLFAKFLTALMLALAPLAVIPLFFASLSFLFAGWLRVLMGGLLMQLIAYIIVGIIVVFLTTFITKAEAAATPDGDSAIWVVFGFLLYGAFVVLFTVLVPVITNAIISGVGVQTAIGAVAGQRGISPVITPLAGAGKPCFERRDQPCSNRSGSRFAFHDRAWRGARSAPGIASRCRPGKGRARQYGPQSVSLSQQPASFMTLILFSNLKSVSPRKGPLCRMLLNIWRD